VSDRPQLPFEYALLGFQMQGPIHGYELHRRARDELGSLWYMGISNIYGSLKRLEQAGLVESALAVQENRPPRKVYHITTAGRQAFLEWVRRPVPSMRDMRLEFPAKLYFLHSLELAGAEDLLAAQEAICRERIERLKQSAARRGCHDFDRLVFDFRRGQIEAILGWLQACRAAWAEMPPDPQILQDPT